MAGARLNQHPADITASIRKSGGTLSKVALNARLHPSSVSKCLRRCLPAANLAVARFLGKSLGDLWPEWFDSDGNRRSTKSDASRNAAAAKSQKRHHSPDRKVAA